ncbi:NAD(P)-dependent oxidoreductase [Rhodoblastus acidophilus]|uniref:NAD(P)-dependent oxidoreductase n=1 Tax=Candidatus Rhodoblastus alkanivorans TaxID=2954117 RepID=A0ABS9Z756_9HYPH|nr:NAD(P)-dependent oxidoreductase [Candidatus Rhodoblastus alkanivorans]MCI4678700.1 NAD(P)-dependent oxidoreductase [Candidatus Rhodoblastus alkanivorans]MCI4683504.1 NAD(P)-dependent oxidoreductase [Candidatus Rhodoblastus alkanivorans]MDI4640819.1 NAD(P)-dependent oxidoreductase [Rhodoblastus acidophilus]
MDIGFIGLGQMGSAIAHNLVKAGHSVAVWNRSPEKTKALVEAGARKAETPAEAAGGKVVVTMLAHDAAVERVVFGEDGVLASPARPIHVSMSTIGIGLAERLTMAHAGAGGGFVSAPVFGRPNAAEAGKLFVVAAGAAEALAVCAPLFAAVGQRTFTVGEDPKAANVIKLCGNYMIMAAIESLAEAMTLAAKNGVDKASLLEVLTSTLFSAPVFKTYGEILVHEQFKPAGFAAPLGLKDMNLVDAAALNAKASMPVLAVLRSQLVTAIARHGEEVDWSAIAKVVDENSGV